ncbi:fimbrial biogenesis chaperone [Yokenella regensburgei]|jgi:fimbrial chaperone protein|uniref:Chaperone protein focC n=1 Tax=Yokenella regensburgei TaxID=158877 RepID=A0AB38FXU1_9ENTR|nr:molecular chaperone [Yokenella regensburgei]EHM45157.1 gram-negative pili assembly chaperone domain protein [Yokenella regensburgei ATCC 43003]KAF1367918.1 fimbrial chaperone protein [Yokenella regensburgei]KFD21836.1 putative fimbrial chaperone [Yokenella regensburgei ATCC 49455]MDQ4428593.1 molecular chaperone [Yokenella regensburgei]QIU89623.1 molecular chaperone [Yokenella regensburgei]
MKGIASALAGMLLCFSSQASVVMTGSRVIYPVGAAEVNVQLTNRDDFPAVVQVWLDAGDEHSTPQTARAPFITTPPVFRLAAKAGQTVRLRYTGGQMPADRESLWWLNFIQIPPVQAQERETNQLLVMLRSRVKVLYRPAGLSGSPLKMAQTSRVWLANGKLNLRNDSGYYLAMSVLTVKGGGRQQVVRSQTIAPWSSVSWAATIPSADAIQMSWINDQGAEMTARVTAGAPDHAAR